MTAGRNLCNRWTLVAQQANGLAATVPGRRLIC
jgi:hypothetical protein